jgi:proteasome activator subunit 4
VYHTRSDGLSRAADELQRTVPEKLRDQDVILRNTENCKERLLNFRKCYQEAANALLAIGKSTKTHWRYDIVALRMIRALIQRDLPNGSPEVEYLLSKATNDHPSLRYVRVFHDYSSSLLTTI